MSDSGQKLNLKRLLITSLTVSIRNEFDIINWNLDSWRREAYKFEGLVSLIKMVKAHLKNWKIHFVLGWSKPTHFSSDQNKFERPKRDKGVQRQWHLYVTPFLFTKFWQFRRPKLPLPAASIPRTSFHNSLARSNAVTQELCITTWTFRVGSHFRQMLSLYWTLMLFLLF